MKLGNFFKAKKLAAVAAAVALTIGAMGCGGSDQAAAPTDSKQVGIVQLVEHQALDATNEGFVKALADRGYTEGKNISYDRQNAQADQSNLQTITQRFISNKVDLIYAIATPAAQTVANSTQTIPIVGSAITDYEGARLVQSNDKPGGNVTGASDLNPIKEQVDLLLALVPNAKTVGVIYTSSEVNSEIQVKIMQEYAESKGLAVKVATISTVNDIQQAANSLVGDVDAFYIPTDNVIASAMANLVSITSPHKLPIICGEENMVKAGGTATYGINYFKLGEQAGNMAADILDGKSKPADMPIQFAKDLTTIINKKAVDELGITVSNDILSKATIIE